jgi:hypothetical protein
VQNSHFRSSYPRRAGRISRRNAAITNDIERRFYFSGTISQVRAFLAVRPEEAFLRRKVDRERIERADRASKLVLDAERQAREAKTARLREQRMSLATLEPKAVVVAKARKGTRGAIEIE